MVECRAKMRRATASFQAPAVKPGRESYVMTLFLSSTHAKAPRSRRRFIHDLICRIRHSLRQGSAPLRESFEGQGRFGQEEAIVHQTYSFVNEVGFCRNERIAAPKER